MIVGGGIGNFKQQNGEKRRKENRSVTLDSDFDCTHHQGNYIEFLYLELFSKREKVVCAFYRTHST